MLEITKHKNPIIAKVHGAAFAAGCQLVASCDLAYASQVSKFATGADVVGLNCYRGPKMTMKFLDEIRTNVC